MIALENLNITKMQKNHHLAKSIADVSWNMFITITKSKVKDAGSRVILVDPRNTSQQCSGCGMIVTKTLSDRVHSCPHCGLVMDRDQNAAINILRLGLQEPVLKNPGCPDFSRGSSHKQCPFNTNQSYLLSCELPRPKGRGFLLH